MESRLDEGLKRLDLVQNDKAQPAEEDDAEQFELLHLPARSIIGSRRLPPVIVVASEKYVARSGLITEFSNVTFCPEITKHFFCFSIVESG